MRNIYQSPSEDGPEINFNEENKTFKITGNSYPENCEKIYEPILHFIENYKVEENKTLNFYFHFNLINSTSTVYVAQMVIKIAELVEKGLTVSLKWHYDKFDEELLDLGEKLASISKLPIEFIAVDDED